MSKTWDDFIQTARTTLHALKKERAGAGEPTDQERQVFALLMRHYMDQEMGPGPLLEEFGDEYAPPPIV